MNPLLPDPRPWPTDPVKNELLVHAGILAQAKRGLPVSKAALTLAHESLSTGLNTMLAQNHYLGLAVALAMAPDEYVYQSLWEVVQQSLLAQGQEQQFVVLPLVAVIGAKAEGKLDSRLPEAQLQALFAQEAALAPLARLTWHPHLVNAPELAAVNAGQWYQAKANPEAAALLAHSLPERALTANTGQQVLLLFAIGWGSAVDIDAARAAYERISLPMMQLWNAHWHPENMTVFVNPLPPATPLAGLSEGTRMRQLMALDVFAANAIRAIRLQSPRVGAVVAAAEGGSLLFGFNATEAAYALATQVFEFPLQPLDSLEGVLGHFLNLMQDCRIDHVRVLQQILSDAALPDYAAALALPGLNPLTAAAAH